MSNNDLTIIIETESGKEPTMRLQPGTGLQWLAQKHSLSAYLHALQALGVFVGDIKLQKKNANGINNIILDGLHVRLVREMHLRWPQAFGDNKEPFGIFNALYAQYDMQLAGAVGGTLQNIAKINDPQYWLLRLDPTDYRYYGLYWTNNGWSYHKTAEDAKKFIETVPKTIAALIYGEEKVLELSPEQDMRYHSAYQTKTSAVQKHWVDRSKLGCLWVLGQRDGDDSPLFYEKAE